MEHIAQILNRRFQVMELDVTKKIKKVKIVSKTFTPEGGTAVQYKQLVLDVVLNGNVVSVESKINRDKALLIESATTSEDNPDFLAPEIQ